MRNLVLRIRTNCALMTSAQYFFNTLLISCLDTLLAE